MRKPQHHSKDEVLLDLEREYATLYEIAHLRDFASLAFAEHS
jgi:hypothetical protein